MKEVEERRSRHEKNRGLAVPLNNAVVLEVRWRKGERRAEEEVRQVSRWSVVRTATGQARRDKTRQSGAEQSRTEQMRRDVDVDFSVQMGAQCNGPVRWDEQECLLGFLSGEGEERRSEWIWVRCGVQRGA